MKITVLAVLALGMMACSKEEAPSAAAAKSTSAPAAATPEAKPADAKPAEAKPAEAPKNGGASVQKALEGREIVGYLKDPKDDGVCVALSAKKEEVATMTKEKIAEVAKFMKGEVTDGCSADGVVGTCNAMGMLQSFYGPKYTKETAKAACDKDHGKWFE